MYPDAAYFQQVIVQFNKRTLNFVLSNFKDPAQLYDKRIKNIYRHPDNSLPAWEKGDFKNSQENPKQPQKSDPRQPGQKNNENYEYDLAVKSRFKKSKVPNIIN